MILKMVRNYRSKDDSPPEMVVECDRYIVSSSIKASDLEGDVIYFWDDGAGNRKPTICISAFQEGRDPKRLMLSNAEVFVMNNDGKTVDRIYT